jgi:hypothetical protein
MNMIANKLITTENIDISEQIFGPNIRSLKGKTKKNKPVVNNFLYIPDNLIMKQMVRRTNYTLHMQQ